MGAAYAANFFRVPYNMLTFPIIQVSYFHYIIRGRFWATPDGGFSIYGGPLSLCGQGFSILPAINLHPHLAAYRDVSAQILGTGH